MASLCAQMAKFVKPPSVKRGFLRRLLRDVEEHGERKLELARYDRLLGDPDYHLLKQLTSLDVNAMLKRYVSKLHQHHPTDDHIGAPPALPARRLHVRRTQRPACMAGIDKPCLARRASVIDVAGAWHASLQQGCCMALCQATSVMMGVSWVVRVCGRVPEHVVMHAQRPRCTSWRCA